MVPLRQLPAVLLIGLVIILLFLQLLSLFIFKWRNRSKRREGIAPSGPWQIWVDRVLSAYPLLTLLGGIALPAGFSVAGLYASEFQVDVNLDFSSYLAAELEEQYLYDLTTGLAREQVDRSQNLQDRGQERWASWNFVSASLASENHSSRRLQSVRPLESNFWKLDIFYQAKDPEKGIFTREALEEIRDFERRIHDFPRYTEFCRKKFNPEICDPSYSVTNIFFSVPNATEITGADMKVIYDGSGSLADIDDVLEGFLRDGLDWWVDKDFGPQNLKSQYTRATFFGGLPLAGYPDLVTRLEEQRQKSGNFLKDLWRDLLRRTEITGKDRLNYEHVIFSWHESRYLYNHEVNYYLINDCWFCAGTIILVTSLVLLRTQNLFTTLCGVLGVVLAFTSTYYFHIAVMGYQRLTVMDLVSIFLIIAIAADDILLLYNTYQLAPAMLVVDDGSQLSPAEKMRWAYRKASLAMLVTSATTCGSFYANLLSIVSVVRGFGFFMGTLVLWNFVNVLTIFAASLLVSEIYLAPLLRCWRKNDPGPCCVQPDCVSPAATSRRRSGELSAASTQRVSQDPSSIFALDAHIGELGCIERQMDTKIRPCLVTCRWPLLVASLGLSGLFIFLAYTGFRVASGEIVVFESDLNLGRMKMLITEVFPSYTSSDLNNNLVIVNPVWPTTLPSCPRLGDNSTWCSGHGSCNTFTGRCSCEDQYAGNGCSVLRRNDTLELSSWPSSSPGNYEFLHILSRPSLIQSPASLDFSATVELANRGDDLLEWSLTVPASSRSWMGLVPSSGAVAPRSFSPLDDAIYLGQGAFVVKYFTGSRPAGFLEQVNATLEVTNRPSQTVRFWAFLMQPPALAALDIDCLDVNFTAELTPPFALDFGFSDNDTLNLALPGQTPQPWYNISLPFAVQRIAVHTELFGTAERVEVNGIQSSGISEAIELSPEPAINIISIQVFSAYSEAVSIVYKLEVLRASTSTTSTTRTMTLLKGEISINVNDCLLLLDSEQDLVLGLAALLGQPAWRIAVEVRCSRRMTGAVERELLSSALVLYELRVPGSEAADVVDILDTTSATSLSQTLQAALDASGNEGVSLSVTAVVVEGGTRTTSGSTTRSSTFTRTTGTPTTTATAVVATTGSTATIMGTSTSRTSTLTSSSTSLVTSTITSSSSTVTVHSATATSTTAPGTATSTRSYSTSYTLTRTTSSTGSATTVTSTVSTVSTSEVATTTTSTALSTATSAAAATSNDPSSTATEQSGTSTGTRSVTGSTTKTASETTDTATSEQPISTITNTSTMISSPTTIATSSTVTSVTVTVSTTVFSASSVTTQTATSTFLDYVISGSIAMEVSDCESLQAPSGQEGLRRALAEAAGVDPSYIQLTVSCVRRMSQADEADEARRLSVSATVDYVIDPPTHSMDEMLWLTNTAHSNLLSETSASLSQKIELAMASTGASVSVTVIEIGQPSVSISSETTTSPSTTTAYCPGNPVCGGISGQCVVAVNDSRSWRCECSETYDGEACEIRTCPRCQNNGTCVSGTQSPHSQWSCDCPEGFQGTHCEFFRCPNDCSNSGDCNAETGLCACFVGYLQEDCSETTNWKVPFANCIEVHLTWGLNGHQVYNTSAPDYNSMFDLFAPETQAWLLETCQLARAQEELMVREELMCWIEGFKNFVNLAGGIFPVESPELASQALQAFMHQDAAKPFYGDVSTSGLDYDGPANFARVRLKINVAKTGNTTYRTAIRKRWEEFAKSRNEGAPANVGVMLMVSSTWMQMEMESKVVSSTMMAFAGSITVSLLAVALFTQNAIIALYVCLNIVLVVCILAGFLLNVMGYEFGVAEAIGATIFVGLSVDYCLHLAHAYNEAPSNSSRQKIRQALVVIGPSILGGASTTIVGTAFLLPCRILLFQKLGWSLFANSTVSILLTFSFLCPMLIILGPTGRQGDLCPCLRRSLSKAGTSRVYASDEPSPRADADADSYTDMVPEVTGQTLRSDSTFRLDVQTNKSDSAGPEAPEAPEALAVAAVASENRGVNQVQVPSQGTDGTFNVDDMKTSDQSKSSVVDLA